MKQPESSKFNTFLDKRNHLWIGGCVCILLGICLGILIEARIKVKPDAPVYKPLRDSNTGYKFTNPLLACDISKPKDITKLKPLEEKIRTLLSRPDLVQTHTTASVYFRELSTGRWTAVNEEQTYNPASLLKIPIMIAYYKAAEKQPEILAKRIVYQAGGPDLNASENFKPRESIKVGQSYTIQQLIEHMVGYSDNNAVSLLIQAIEPSIQKEVYTDISLSYPDVNGQVKPMGVKDYSYFFRILYNATYLTKDLSEKALKVLSTRSFPLGLNAGVPSDIVMSEKFGERSNVDVQKNILSRELHDCGIVYYPQNPYLVCVMTKGQTTFETLEGLIKDISHVAYEEAISQ